MYKALRWLQSEPRWCVSLVEGLGLQTELAAVKWRWSKTVASHSEPIIQLSLRFSLFTYWRRWLPIVTHNTLPGCQDHTVKQLSSAVSSSYLVLSSIESLICGFWQFVSYWYSIITLNSLEITIYWIRIVGVNTIWLILLVLFKFRHVYLPI